MIDLMVGLMVYGSCHV